jgi:transposase InsO family protein
LIYQFVDTEKANFPIYLICKVLNTPTSSYYHWVSEGRRIEAERAAAEAELIDAIRVVHEWSNGTYGAVKIHDHLRKAGRKVSCRRVAELMSKYRIYGVSGRQPGMRTTLRDATAAPFEDLVERRFQPCRPDIVWYGDITYLWVNGRFWFLATVIDAATKQVIGWAFADHMRTDLVSSALHSAVRRRGRQIRAGIIFHSDRGSQYTSTDFGKVCALYKIRQSMGRTGVCWDNAAAESFFATLKRELIYRYRWNDPKVLHRDLYWWIEAWYNNQRTHTSLGLRTPNQAHQDHYQPNAA